MIEEKLTYREALRIGLRAAIQSNDRVFLLGEDVGHYGGAFAASKGLLTEFGAEKIMDVPLSEAGFTGAAIGAAIAGLKPIVEIMTINFSLLALDQIINNAATLSHMSNGQIKIPLVIRMSCGPGRQLAAQHSHSWEPIFAMIPGLIVLSAGTHSDAEQMVQKAIKKNNPVVILEYTSLLNTLEFTPRRYEDTIEKSIVLQEGTDLAILTYGTGVYKSIQAVQNEELKSFSILILDLRILRPLDYDQIKKVVKKTGRVLIVEDAWGTISIGSALTAYIHRACFYDLDYPVQHLSGKEVPTPYPLHLEQHCTPTFGDIVNRCKLMMNHG